MKVCVFQCDLAGHDRQSRLARLERVARQSPARLILCPELFMSGYNVGADLARRGEPADGPFATAVAAIARDTGKIVVYGYPERADGVLYNSALVIDDAGRTLANHRKLVIPPGFERDWFAPGHGLSLCDLDGVRVALAICYDAEFPETVRAAAMAGAKIVLAPTALARRWRVVADKVMPARAFENGVYLLYANHAGSEGDLAYAGASCIVDPCGSELARAGAGEEVITASIDASQVAAARRRLPYLNDVAGLVSRLK